jgi:hypothetical protein
MAQDYTYNRGEWTDGNSLPEWIDNEDFYDYLERTGYKEAFKFSQNSIGDEMATIFKNEDATAWFAAICLDCDRLLFVFLPDFPSLMMFTKDYAPAINLIANSFEQNDIRKMLEKLFHAYHGHYAEDYCYQCDPRYMEETKKWRQEHAAKKAAKKLESENKESGLKDHFEQKKPGEDCS